MTKFTKEELKEAYKEFVPKVAPTELDCRILSKLVTTSIQEFMSSGLTEDMLLSDEAKSAFHFINGHIKSYKVLPSLNTLKNNGFEDVCALPAPEPLKHYMDFIVERKVFRTFNATLKESADALKEKNHGKIATIMGAALLTFQKLTRVQNQVLTSNDMLKVYNQMIMDDLNSDGITTPWAQANRYGPILRKGDIGVVAGRIGQGKTWTCQVMALHAQLVQGKKVLFYSLEMPEDELIFRDSSIRNNINPTQINKKELTTTLINKIKSAKSDNPIIYKGNNQIRNLNTVRADISIYQPEFVVIDAAYILGTGVSSKFAQSKYDKISTVIQGIRDMATEFNIPMILSYQINREGAKSKEKGAVMDLSHIAGSDDIGQLAAWVMILDNVEKDNKERGVQIPKTRKGERDSFVINWDIANANFSQAENNHIYEEDHDQYKEVEHVQNMG